MATKKQTETKKQTDKTASKLYNLCKASLSKNGNYVNLTIIRGSDDNIEFANIPVKICEDKETFKCKVKDGKFYLMMPLKETKQKDPEDDLF